MRRSTAVDQASSLRRIIKEKRGVPAARGANHSEPAGALPPRVVSVTSGKGGVGKTHIVANLAVALSRLGKRILVLDADLGLANIDIIFGVHPEYNIGDVVTGEKTLPEIIVEGPSGVRIIPAGSGFVNLTQLTDGQKMSLMGEFEALEDRFDMMLVDTSAGISQNVIYFNLSADDCMVVATPEPTSITDAYAVMKVMGLQHGTRYFKLLVNMVKDDREAKAVYANLCQATDRFLEGVVIEYVGFIPLDDLVRKAVKHRKSMMEMYPEAEFSKGIERIAEELLEWPRTIESDGNIKFFLKRYLEFRAENDKSCRRLQSGVL
ncbi:MAG: MinD/ParA family protein [Desulfobacteraceae bacterium]|nr:MAG: MinD/ParA family protein [Desulfobacteraceae bacterium]